MLARLERLLRCKRVRRPLLNLRHPAGASRTSRQCAMQPCFRPNFPRPRAAEARSRAGLGGMRRCALRILARIRTGKAVAAQPGAGSVDALAILAECLGCRYDFQRRG